VPPLRAHHGRWSEVPRTAVGTTQLLHASGLRSSVPIGGAHEVLPNVGHLLRHAIDGIVAPREHWESAEILAPLRRPAPPSVDPSPGASEVAAELLAHEAVREHGPVPWPK
jgi:hypothetical protein